MNARCARKMRARASAVAPVAAPARPATNLLARAPMVKIATGPVRRTTAAPLTRMQKNSEGRPSEWAASPNFFTDPAWSQTVSNQSDKR